MDILRVLLQEPKAMRQAVDATLGGKSLEEYAKAHKELSLALKH